MGIKEDAASLLCYLSNYQASDDDDQRGRYSLKGPNLTKALALTPNQLNDAVILLEDNGYARLMKFLGTAPFRFDTVELTTRGRVEAERIQSDTSSPAPASGSQDAVSQAVALDTNVTPVGSPYGFTEQDWAAVAVDKADPKFLIVVFGYKWESDYYESTQLESNVKTMFANALEQVAESLSISIDLHFKPLQGGYGAHLFNQVARDIIGADIVVFDTSDLSPNVMIELGVALTWGKSILLIRNEKSEKPPSDISGQTWAEYSGNGCSWSVPNHDARVMKQVEFAVKRKVGSGT